MDYRYCIPWAYTGYRTYTPDCTIRENRDFCCMEKGTIRVNGEGLVKVHPNKAAVTLGTVSRSRILSEAVNENNRITQDVINALAGQGIERKKIKTLYFNVNPIYIEEPGKTQTIEGYEVTNAVEVDASNIDMVGTVIEAGISAGANKVNNIRFYNDDPEVREMALREAIEEANQKARTIADELSLRILRIKSVNGGWNIARPFFMDMAVKAETTVPISPGEIEVTSSINIEYYVEQ